MITINQTIVYHFRFTFSTSFIARRKNYVTKKPFTFQSLLVEMLAFHWVMGVSNLDALLLYKTTFLQEDDLLMFPMSITHTQESSYKIVGLHNARFLVNNYKKDVV